MASSSEEEEHSARTMRNYNTNNNLLSGKAAKEENDICKFARRVIDYDTDGESVPTQLQSLFLNAFMKNKNVRAGVGLDDAERVKLALLIIAQAHGYPKDDSAAIRFDSFDIETGYFIAVFLRATRALQMPSPTSIASVIGVKVTSLPIVALQRATTVLAEIFFSQTGNRPFASSSEWDPLQTLFQEHRGSLFSSEGGSTCKPHQIQTMIVASEKMAKELKTLGQRLSLEEFTRGILSTSINVIKLSSELDCAKAATAQENNVRHFISPKVESVAETMRGKCYVSLTASLISALMQTFAVAGKTDFECRFFEFARGACRLADRHVGVASDETKGKGFPRNKGIPRPPRGNFDGHRSNGNYANFGKGGPSNHTGGMSNNFAFRRGKDHQQADHAGPSSSSNMAKKGPSTAQEIVRRAREEGNAGMLKNVTRPHGQGCRRKADCWLCHDGSSIGEFRISAASTCEKLRAWADKKKMPTPPPRGERPADREQK